MKRIYLDFMRYFAFTTQDRNGLIVLVALILGVLLFKLYYPFCVTTNNRLPNDLIFAQNNQSDYNNNFKDPKYSSDSVSRSPKEKKYAPKTEKKTFTLHLNIADSLDLQELRGIGSGYAKRILIYREKLGGFVRKEQLLEVWGIDSALYESILPSIILDIENIAKININTIDLQMLKKHPYLDYYQAKEIIKYREKIGDFQSVNELKKVNLIDPKTFDKLYLYITI